MKKKAESEKNLKKFEHGFSFFKKSVFNFSLLLFNLHLLQPFPQTLVFYFNLLFLLFLFSLLAFFFSTSVTQNPTTHIVTVLGFMGLDSSSPTMCSISTANPMWKFFPPQSQPWSWWTTNEDQTQKCSDGAQVLDSGLNDEVEHFLCFVLFHFHSSFIFWWFNL